MKDKKLSLSELKLQSFSTEIQKDSREIRQKVAGSGALTGCGGVTCVPTHGCELSDIYTEWRGNENEC
jgi:hypothetical protein